MYQGTKNGKKLLWGIIIGLLCYAIVDIILMISWYDASGIVLDTGWTVEADGETVQADIPYVVISQSAETVVFTNTFDAQQQEKLGLVVPFVSGTAFKVYLNGEAVGGEGLVGDSTANIWYSSFLYPIEALQEGQNELRIEVYGLYDIGFHVPPYIDDYDTARNKVYIADKLRNNLIILLSGMSVAFGVVLLISYFKNKRKDKAQLYAGIIGLLAYFTAVDCVFDVGVGSVLALLWIKKLRFAVMFASIALFLMISYETMKEKKKHLPFVVLAVTVLSYIPIVVSSSFYDWYTWMWIAFVLQGVNIILMVYFTFSAARYRVVNIMMCVMIPATFIQGLLSNLFEVNVPNPLQFSFITIAVAIGVTYITQLNKVYKEKHLYEKAAIKDTMTDAYNRRMIERVQAKEGDCVVVMDVDNFKGVNDSHGHLAGDHILISLAERINGITRRGDILIRLGGDEFCVLMRDCPIEQAQKKMYALDEVFTEEYAEHGIGISFGLCMIEEGFKPALSCADKRMYEMKSAKKM